MPIQFEKIRRDFDPQYQRLHDELTDCYRAGKPFREHGLLTEEIFEKLHAKLWHLYTIGFHNANMALDPSERIPEAEYRYEYDANGAITADKVQAAKDFVNTLKIGSIG